MSATGAETASRAPASTKASAVIAGRCKDELAAARPSQQQGLFYFERSIKSFIFTTASGQNDSAQGVTVAFGAKLDQGLLRTKRLRDWKLEPKIRTKQKNLVPEHKSAPDPWWLPTTKQNPSAINSNNINSYNNTSTQYYLLRTHGYIAA